MPSKRPAIEIRRPGRKITSVPNLPPWRTDPLPTWTRTAGGEKWRKWVARRIAACDRRARAWAANRPDRPVPTREQWGLAIWRALKASNGRGRYSRFPLSLAGHPTDWNWPSVDHMAGLDAAHVVLETRLVNDMKTIMSAREFRSMIGHLAAVNRLPAREVSGRWRCRRSFKKIEEPLKEPPLPR